MTEGYARMVARLAYVWLWPILNMVGRRARYENVATMAYVGGAPTAPLNELVMLTDYIAPEARGVACPNQDVIYGAGMLALDRSPTVLQVPDFGGRFWVYQVVDARTDQFAALGAMHGTKPGFYLLAGRDWQGVVPARITGVFRADTSSGYVLPRVFVDDTDADHVAVQEVLRAITMYPLARFDGLMRSIDWTGLPTVAAPPPPKGEIDWVQPARFIDSLPTALADAPARPGETAIYAQVKAVLAACRESPTLRRAVEDEVAAADRELVAPLFAFSRWGERLLFGWSTVFGTASFGHDYFTRTAVARSNIFVNAASETRYYYQEHDASDARLDGERRYELAFGPGQTPPVRGFWSLSVYDEHHFFVPNRLGRYSVGSKSHDLAWESDGSLVIRLQSEAPSDIALTNWLPTPRGVRFCLMIRAYWPDMPSAGRWMPPPVTRVA